METFVTVSSFVTPLMVRSPVIEPSVALFTVKLAVGKVSTLKKSSDFRWLTNFNFIHCIRHKKRKKIQKIMIKFNPKNITTKGNTKHFCF